MKKDQQRTITKIVSLNSVRANALAVSFIKKTGLEVLNIVIKSSINNASSIVICNALKQRGHEVHISSLEGFPAKLQRSIRVGKSETVKTQTKLDKTSLFKRGNADVVIWPEREKIRIAQNASAQDEAHIRLESELFLSSLNYFFDDETFWINPLASYARAGLKPVQLLLAQEAGFRIPETLVSNNADDILHFVNNQKSGAIAKSFTTANWVEADDTFYFPTTVVTKDDIRDSIEEIQLCPTIYQERIHRNYEVRVTVMGRTTIAVKILTPPEGKVDSREHTQTGEFEIEAFELPLLIKEQCFKVMDALGLVFGCFDLIVDKNGNYIFLEVNNSGQFLWKETMNKNFPMLHIYTQFIESQDPHFIWNGNR